MKISDIKKGYASLNEGLWVALPELPPFDLLTGLRLKSRRLFNPDYTALRDKLFEDAKKDDAGVIAPADLRQIQDECMVQTCILDWTGIDDPYSADLARSALSDPEAGDAFRSAFLWAANHTADAYRASLEADTKN